MSSKEQNLDRQIEAFKALGADERDIITDKESGKKLGCLALTYPDNWKKVYAIEKTEKSPQKPQWN